MSIQKEETENFEKKTLRKFFTLPTESIIDQQSLNLLNSWFSLPLPFSYLHLHCLHLAAQVQQCHWTPLAKGREEESNIFFHCGFQRGTGSGFCILQVLYSRRVHWFFRVKQPQVNHPFFLVLCVNKVFHFLFSHLTKDLSPKNGGEDTKIMRLAWVRVKWRKFCVASLIL